jgi:SAM-dependent methyltransferase
MVDAIAGPYRAALARYASGRLVDVGCGAVPLYGMYRDRVDHVLCVDWLNTTHGGIHVDAWCDLNVALPLQSACADTVVMTDVLEHLRAPHRALAESARILRSGGHLVLGVPFLYPIHEAPHDHWRFTRWSLATLIEDAGLRIVSLEETGGWPEVWGTLTAKAIERWAPIARLFTRSYRTALGWSWMKRISARSRATYPLGYLAVARKP